MAELSERQLVYSFIKYLNQSKSKSYADQDTLNVCIQCLSDQFNVDINNEEHERKLNVCPDLLETFKSLYPVQPEETDPYSEYKNDEHFQQFISLLKTRGYFKSDDIYDEINKDRLEKAILKYKAKFTAQPAAPSTPVVTEEDKAEAESLKEQGNQYLVQRDYDSAIDCYSKAIQKDGKGEKSHIYYANRAAAYIYLKQYEKAIEDCEEAIRLCPSYIRAYTRLGGIYNTLKQYQKAIEVYEKGLHYEPNNTSLLESKNRAMNELNANSNANSNANNNTNANPLAGLGNLLNDPNMRQQFSNVASSILGGLGGNNNNANTSNASNGEEEEESNANNNNGGFNLGGLLNDPNVRNMAQNIMNNPDMMNNLLNTFGGLFGGNRPNNGNNNYYS